MANQIYISYANPVNFYEVTPADIPQYLSRAMDDYLFTNRIRTDQTELSYKQKWTVHDAIPLQFETNFDPIQIDVIDCTGHVYFSVNAVKRSQNKNIPGYYAYEVNLSLAALSEGTYYLYMTLGGTTLMISEPFEVGDGAGTILFEYNNSAYHADILFQTGIMLRFRVEGVLKNFDPSSERTSYRDQRLNPTVLKSVPFRSWELHIGKDYGVPDWVADKLNWIFSCDNVLIDGKPYAVLEDSKIEGADIHPMYPMRSYTIKIQEGINRASKIVGVAVDPNKRIFVAAFVDTTIFGDLSGEAGDNLIQIQDVE
jgi:hypothetical protein